MHDVGLPHLREALFFLTLAGVLVPLMQRLRVNAVFGFLAVGALVGPFGLGALAEHYPWARYVSFPRLDGVIALAELGVLFLMFSIGLELSLDRLAAMRRWVFGAGLAQVALCGLAIGAIAYAAGAQLAAAAVIGAALALSSTAVVMQLLAQRKELGTPLGRASFSVLLFQDLAVVPLLLLVGLLADREASFAATAGLALVKGVAAIALIYFLGKAVVRPVFRRFVTPGQPDSFMALTLLATLGIAALTWLAGLSLALGAFLAGLLLAETEYRHEVEVTIDPFRGLFLGLFFFTVGMGIDLHAILDMPLALAGAIAALFLVKAVITGVVLRAFGLTAPHALEAGVLLGQGGEFGFVLIGAALLAGVLERDAAQFVLMVIGIGLLATPGIARLARMLAARWEAARGGPRGDALPEIEAAGGHVVIAGFGRVGQMLGQLLEAQRVPYVAIEADPRVAGDLHRAGKPVHFGDVSRPELLRRLGLARASAVIITVNQSAAALRAVHAIRRQFPHVKIYARAVDEPHALLLRQAGATIVVPETLESSLRLAAFVLGDIGLAEDAAERIVQVERDRRIASYAGGAASATTSGEGSADAKSDLRANPR